MMQLENAVQEFIEDKKEYYYKWIYDKPLLISHNHHMKLVTLHSIMHKLILNFVNNFNDYKHLINVSKRSEEIISALENVTYKVGTFRTDFVYDFKKQPKLIEITCRFALNGFIISSVYNSIAQGYNSQNCKDLSTVNPYSAFLTYLNRLSKKGVIYILKGDDKKNESILYKDIFEKAGRKIIEIYYDKISLFIDKIGNDSFIICELTIDEIESIDIEVIKKLATLNIINDFRTALLIHDKQFFSVLRNQHFLHSCLSNQEILFFKEFIIPTYNYNQKKDLWDKAKYEKDLWILKHKALGKSKSIYAGIVTPEEEWKTLFSKDDLENFVLQKWVPQTKINGTLNGKEYNDYITGTLLFFNENYFGLGMFRTSSFPITNVLDDRKVTSLVLANSFDKIKKNKFLELIDS